MMTVQQRFDLTGKVAVVIGGTGVLCGVMAGGLAEAGAKVVLVGRSEEKAKANLDLIRQAGGEASFEPCDASVKAEVEGLLKNVIEKHGRADVLVNGAGVNSATPFLDIPEDEIDRILSINLKGVIFACQVFAKHWLDAGKAGSIINVGSASGLTPLSRVFTYSASKAAVHNLTKNLAREWAEKGIRVNALVPGFIPAEQNKKVLTEERVAQIMGHTPMKRFGKPDELIGATLLLASDAGAFITGAELVVDGGFNAMTI
jgi:NAD(P)-dependent dehydrogenase (short-subunit alcohol dehydrogenase family)